MLKAGPHLNPQEYFKYFEALKCCPNTEIGPKDIFETASKFYEDPAAYQIFFR